MLADPGVGKTSAVYGAFKILKAKGMASKMLVVAPLKPCHLVWPAEQEKWTDFNGLRVVVLHGPNKEKLLQQDADVYVVNFDGLDWLTGASRTKSLSNRVTVQVDMKRFRRFGFDILCVDELTKFKHPQSGRSKLIKCVLSTFKRRWGLTGTPVPNGLMDLFGEMYVLDMGRSFGPYITHFRAKYFIQSYDGYTWSLREGAKEEIYERIEPLCLRLAAEDYVDMPMVVDTFLRFDLPPEARRVYDAVEGALFARIGGNQIVAKNAASASIKCRQITSGAVYLDDEIANVLEHTHVRKKAREWVEMHNEKIELVDDLVAELQGSPLLVGYEFQHDLERLRHHFGADVPVIGGGTSTKDALKIERAWNTGDIPLMFAHPQAAGHGLNLQGGTCHHVAWFTPTWDYELYDQFIRRIRRQGNAAERVFVHHFVARDTVEEAMVWSIDGKGKGQDSLFAALREMAKKRRK